MNLDMELLERFNEHRNDIRADLFIEPYGIHGIPHAERVMYLALSISKYEEYSESDMSILIEASKFHDIGRTHDGVCLIHGMLSNKKINKYDLISGFYDEDVNVIKYIIHAHCIGDKDTHKSIEEYNIEDKHRAKRLLMAFKDSDGLDRVRVEDLNPKYLRTDSSKNLISLAEYLLSSDILSKRINI